MPSVNQANSSPQIAQPPKEEYNKTTSVFQVIGAVALASLALVAILGATGNGGAFLNKLMQRNILPLTMKGWNGVHMIQVPLWVAVLVGVGAVACGVTIYKIYKYSQREEDAEVEPSQEEKPKENTHIPDGPLEVALVQHAQNQLFGRPQRLLPDKGVVQMNFSLQQLKDILRSGHSPSIASVFQGFTIVIEKPVEPPFIAPIDGEEEPREVNSLSLTAIPIRFDFDSHTIFIPVGLEHCLRENYDGTSRVEVLEEGAALLRVEQHTPPRQSPILSRDITPDRRTIFRRTLAF